MSLNSFATPDGREISRSQAVQAEACGIEPNTDMNPILLKPVADSGSQVVLQGKPYTNLTARGYYSLKKKLWKYVCESFERLSHQYDIVVIEGAGSPAEVNLKANDIVNMRVAKHTNSPVLLIGDIDKGGVFAWLVGTLDLLEEDERELVKGFLINKFRGDVSLLKPGLDFLEEKTGKPVLGVIPYARDLKVQEEDSVALDNLKLSRDEAEINISIIRLPRISNFTDFDPLLAETDVALRYVTSPDELSRSDIIIIPGTKNTSLDLKFLIDSGISDQIIHAREQGAIVIGICGGFQMLGRELRDPHGVESSEAFQPGLGLLDVVTRFTKEKATYQAKAKVVAETPYLKRGETLTGYEIHMGITESSSSLFELSRRSGVAVHDGVASEDGLVFGTYLHGLFDNAPFTRNLLNFARKRKGLAEIYPPQVDVATERQREYDRLAEIVRNNVDVDRIYEIMMAR
jgi:adenosylcobyric acid synthase